MIFIVVIIVVMTLVCIINDESKLKKEARDIIIGFYKPSDHHFNFNIYKTNEIYFKNNGTCDILYYKDGSSSFYLKQGIPYVIYGNKVYIKFTEKDNREFKICLDYSSKSYYLEERRDSKKEHRFTKITYEESRILSIQRKHDKYLEIKKIKWKETKENLKDK